MNNVLNHISYQEHSRSIDAASTSAEINPLPKARCFHPVTEIVHSYITQRLKEIGIDEIIDIGGVGKLNDRFSKVFNAIISQGVDGCRLPFADGSFQASISIATLEHVHDQVGFLKEAVRVAREISLHWFPFGEQGRKIEQFKEMMGHRHPCEIPKQEIIGKAMLGYHYEIIPFVTCSEHLLCLACLYPQLNTPDLYRFIFENMDTYCGAVLKVNKKRKTEP